MLFFFPAKRLRGRENSCTALSSKFLHRPPTTTIGKQTHGTQKSCVNQREFPPSAHATFIASFLSDFHSEFGTDVSGTEERPVDYKNFVQTIVVVDTLRSWERNRPRFGRLYLEEDNRRRRHRRRGDDSACKNRTRRPSIYGCVDNYYTSLRYYWHLTDGDAEVQRHHKIATIQEAGRRGCSWLGYDDAFFFISGRDNVYTPKTFSKKYSISLPLSINNTRWRVCAWENKKYSQKIEKWFDIPVNEGSFGVK